MKEIISPRNIGSAAAFGFGASAGRDIWKWLKAETAQAFAWLVLLGALTLPISAGRGLTQGYDRRVVETIFRTVFGSLLLLTVGIGLAWVCLLLPTYDEIQPYRGVAVALFYAVTSSSILFVLGAVWGMFKRPGRKRSYAVARHNEQFLNTHGIIETKASDATHVGPDGVRLRLLGL